MAAVTTDSHATSEQELDELEALIVDEPQRADREIEAWLRTADRASCDRTRAFALKSRALQRCGNLEGAVAASHAAVVEAEHAHQQGTPASLRTTITALGCHLEVGRPLEGFPMYQRLAAVACPAERLQLDILTASSLYSAGIYDRALDILNDVATRVGDHTDTDDAFRSLNARALLFLELGRDAEAERILDEGLLLLASRGALVPVTTICKHNRGVAIARQGRIHEALRILDDCETEFSLYGEPTYLLEGLADRIELLVDLGLVDEAHSAIRRHASLEREIGADFKLHRLLVLESEIETSLGNWAAAARAAQASHELVAAEHRGDVIEQRSKELSRLLAAVADDEPRFPTGTDVEAVGAATLTDIGIHLRSRGRHSDARRAFDLVRDAPARGGLSEMHRSLARAYLAALDGDATALMLAVQSCFDAANANALSQGATDLRTLARRRVRQATELALSSISRSNRPAIDSAEMIDRALHAAFRPEPPISAEESECLHLLRGLSRRSSNEPDNIEIVRQRSVVESRLKNLRRLQLQEDAVAIDGKVVELRPVGCDALYMHVVGDEVYVVSLTEHGDDVWSCDDAALRRDVVATNVLLESIAKGAGAATDVGPLVRQLATHFVPVSSSDTPLVVIADDRLPMIPWALLTDRPISVMPHAPRRRVDTSPTSDGFELGDVRLALISGPGVDLEACEAAGIERVWPRVERIMGEAATVQASLHALAEDRMAHISAHGQFRNDNPLFSDIQLADGAMTMYDLLSTARSPEHIVFAACSIGLDGSKSPIGTFALLHSRGCTTMIAGTGPLRDDSLNDLMPAYYELLHSGQPPVWALRTALSSRLSRDPSLALLTCFGGI